MTEDWRAPPGFEDTHEVSSLGREIALKSIAANTVMKIKLGAAYAR